jgi:hypothetical protein
MSFIREKKSSYTFLVEVWGKELLGKPRGRWRDNYKMEIYWGVGWIDLALNRDKWRAVLNAAMNSLFPYNAWNLLISWEAVCFPRRTLLCGLVGWLVGRSISQSVIEKWMDFRCVFPSFYMSFYKSVLKFISALLLYPNGQMNLLLYLE